MCIYARNKHHRWNDTSHGKTIVQPTKKSTKILRHHAYLVQRSEWIWVSIHARCAFSLVEVRLPCEPCGSAARMLNTISLVGIPRSMCDLLPRIQRHMRAKRLRLTFYTYERGGSHYRLVHGCQLSITTAVPSSIDYNSGALARILR